MSITEDDGFKGLMRVLSFASIPCLRFKLCVRTKRGRAQTSSNCPTHVSFGNVRVLVAAGVILYVLLDLFLQSRSIRPLVLIHPYFVSEEQERRRGGDVVCCSCSLGNKEAESRFRTFRGHGVYSNWTFPT